MPHNILRLQLINARPAKRRSDGQAVLADNSHKKIMIDSFQYLANDRRIESNAFVPMAIGMSNHIHVIWQVLSNCTPSGVQASFMKYTAQQIKRSLGKNDSDGLSGFKVNKYDM